LSYKKPLKNLTPPLTLSRLNKKYHPLRYVFNNPHRVQLFLRGDSKHYNKRTLYGWNKKHTEAH